MSTHFRSRSADTRERKPFLRRELGGEPYWFIITACAMIAVIVIFAATR